jgi:hypothetical protein
MIRKPGLVLLGTLIFGILLSGCPKRVTRLPPIETPPVRNPVLLLLEEFSVVDNFQSRASIRLDTWRDGREISYLLNGAVLYEKPDKLRIMGYHPLGMGLFDALYRNGEFLLLSPFEKRAYTGQVSEFEDLIEKSGVQISTDKTGGSRVPNLIRIAVEQKETRVAVRLKEISINSSLPEDAFAWEVPQGVQVIPLAEFLKRNPS